MRNRSGRVMIMVWMMQALAVQAQKPVNDTIDLMPTLEVSVMLKDDLKTITFPGFCGIFMYHMAFTYKVVKIISGTYGSSTIRIDHICPLENVKYKNIENGKVYTFKLKPASQQSGIHQSSGQLIYEIIGDTSNWSTGFESK